MKRNEKKWKEKKKEKKMEEWKKMYINVIIKNDSDW